jgi:hypothetical protein
MTSMVKEIPINICHHSLSVLRTNILQPKPYDNESVHMGEPEKLTLRAGSPLFFVSIHRIEHGLEQRLPPEK